MSNHSALNAYITRLQQRLRLGAWLRGAAIFTGTALTVTVVMVLVLNHLAFPEHGVTAARWSIFAALAVAAVYAVAVPLMGMTRARAVSKAEAANPEMEQRLTTFQERASNADDPFLELLAADTLARTQYVAPSSLVPDSRLFALGGAGLGCLAVMLWMIAAGPGYLGYGASLLWTGPKKNVSPLYTITVTPGDVTVRRNSDQLITARVSGMQPDKARLFAHYQSADGWEPVTMQAEPDAGDGATYQFVFAGLPENVEYYVTAGPLLSPRYKVRVVYGGDMLKVPIRLAANGNIEIHPYIPKPNPTAPLEFDIPVEATRGGTLTLEWTRPPGLGGNGRGCDVAEVWLIKSRP